MAKKFTKVLNEIIEDTELKASDKMLYVVLSKYADNKSGESFPSNKRLKELVGASINSIQSSKKRLMDAGYISIEQRFNSNGGRTSNLYRILK